MSPVSRRSILLAVTALAGVALLVGESSPAAAERPAVRVPGDESAPPKADDASSGDEASESAEALALLYTIHNEGYIEPCG